MVTLTRRQRALTLVPVAALSAAATVHAITDGPRSSAGVGVLVARQPAESVPPVFPGAAGASATVPTVGSRTVLVRQSAVTDPVATIPAPALAAYQRAAAVLAESAIDCGLAWPVLAGIGEVESDHGRSGGGTLDPEGIRRPALVGPVPVRDGADTDGGEYDGDPAYDHGVGPLRLLPATWSAVRVDADGDGRRDPQDIDDAALAAAVFLCADGGVLDTEKGRRAALARYNPAPGYGDLVLAWSRAYAVPSPVPDVVLAAAGPVEARAPKRPGWTPASKPSTPKAPAATPAAPVAPAPSPGTAPDPAPAPKQNPVRDALTAAEAGLLCTLEGLSKLLQPEPFRECVERRLHP